MKWASLTVPAAMLSGAAVAQSNSFNHVMGRSVAEQPATRVSPAVHEDTSLDDLEQLRPKTNVTLFYGEDGAKPNKKSAFSVLEVMMKYPAVALEHSAFVRDISCHVAGEDGKDEDGHVVAQGQDGIDIQFTSKEAYDEACKTWPQNGNFVIITHHSGCGKYDQGIRSYHVVNGYTTEESQLSITAQSAERELKDCMEHATLSWGHYEARKKQTTTPSTELKRRQDDGDSSDGDSPDSDSPKDIDTQTPQEIIESGFDFQKDSKVGFIDVQTQADLIDQLLPGFDQVQAKGLKQDAEIMEYHDKIVDPNHDESIEGVKVSVFQIPDESTGPVARRIKKRGANYPRSRDMKRKHQRRAMLQKRWGFLDRIGKAFSGFVKDVVQMPQKVVSAVSNFVQHPSVSSFVDILGATPAGAVAKLAGGLIIGDVTLDLGSRTYGIEVPGPNQVQRVDTPFGQGIEIFKKEGQTSNGKGSGSITLWCVGCGLKGELNVAGSVSFTGIAITAGKINMKGTMSFQLVAGLKADFKYHDKQSKSLVDVNVGPFQIAGIAEAGFFIGIVLNTEFDVQAEGQLEAGFRIEWSNINSVLDIVDGSKSNLDDIKHPKFNPIFDAKGDIVIGAEIGPALSLSFGIKLLSSETLSAKVALLENPSISGIAKFSGHAELNPDTGKVVGTINSDGCPGVAIGFAVNNNLYVSFNAGGKELKTVEIDRRGLYEKNWCLALQSPTAAGPAADIQPTAAPQSTAVPAKIKVKRQDESAPTDTATVGADSEDPTVTATDADFELSAPNATLFTTLSAEAPSMTAEVTGANPFTVEDSLSETDDEDLSMLSANTILEGVDGDHKNSTGPTDDNALAITYAGVLTEDETVALFTGMDGNILSMKLSETTKTAEDVYNFQVFGSTIISDVGERIIHVYKDTQEKFGVSRLRVSQLNSVPATAQMVVLKEYQGALLAVSTDQHFYALTVCQVTVQDVKVNKMYAIDLTKHSIEEGEQILTSEETDDEVTGGKADKCASVPFKVKFHQTPLDGPTIAAAPIA